MVPKERLQSSGVYWLLLFVLLTTGSSHTAVRSVSNTPVTKNYFIDIAAIPKDTLLQTDRALTRSNGTYLLNNLPYSGIIKTLYPNGIIQSYCSVLNGNMHGLYTSFYEDGSAFESRAYRNNLATGRHYGYWPGGKKWKFDYNYFEEKREGLQKKWYQSGQPYLFSHYTNDHEEGLQQGWRENGKLFLNYVVKDGFVYGLQQTALCYTLVEENIRTTKALK